MEKSSTLPYLIKKNKNRLDQNEKKIQLTQQNLNKNKIHKTLIVKREYQSFTSSSFTSTKLEKHNLYIYSSHPTLLHIFSLFPSYPHSTLKQTKNTS